MSVFSKIFKHKSAPVENVLSTVQVPQKIGKFEKISYNQYKNDVLKLFPNSEESEIQKSYDAITLPLRATAGSAGYDIHATTSIVLNPGDSITIPTGLRCKIEDGWFLMITPRSGLGFKWYTRLANTVGIIDSDYFYADNEGHIMIKLRRESEANDNRAMIINMGDAIAQALFIPFGITEDDHATVSRHGGFGSTGK